MNDQRSRQDVDPHRTATRRLLYRFMLWAALWLLCSSVACLPFPAPTVAPAQTPTNTPTPVPTHTATPSPTATATNTPTPTPTPTPHPEVLGHTIDGLRARAYTGGQIRITHTVTETDAYRRVLITYPSDGLAISGMMHIPYGEGPFPVVILNHGYIPPSRFWSGADTWRAADYLARSGYLTISPDFRGLARSDTGPNIFRAGYMIDSLNAVASVKSLPYADSSRVGMWGHSMGGGVTSRAIAVSDKIKAAVLYAPVSADDSERRFGLGGFGSSDGSAMRELLDSLYYWVYSSGFMDRVSPIDNFDNVTAPVSIHIGEADTTTPPRWSRAIRDALEERGKSVEYFEYPRQGHAFAGASWELFNQRVVRFFGRYLR